MKNVYLLLVCCFFSACGTKKEENKPTVTYAEIVFDSSTAAESKSYSYTELKSCTFDASTGLFSSAFGSAGVAELTVKIKGFAKVNAVYTCTQASDNKVFPSIGSYYNGCSVDISVPNSVNSSTFNTYAMYRKDTEIKSYTYAGTCSVDITFSEPSTVRGKVSCSDMAQSHLEGSLRNPIDAATKASIVSSSYFTCSF